MLDDDGGGAGVDAMDAGDGKAGNGVGGGVE